jgi:hypothetical protein
MIKTYAATILCFLIGTSAGVLVTQEIGFNSFIFPAITCALLSQIPLIVKTVEKH